MFWPELRYEAWKDTRQTLHRWTQIVGKIRLSKSPWINHSWGSTLYVTARGLTTSVIHDKDFSFSIDFDLITHHLVITSSDGRYVSLSLFPQSVSVFHEKCLDALSG